MSEIEYLDVSKISIREINKNIAKEMIIKNHYTHKWSLCRVAYGVFYKTGKKDTFTDIETEKLIGCCIFGQPVGRSAANSISTSLKINQVLELTRLWIEDGHGKNIESYSISQSIKLIKKQFTDIKCILSYSDTEQHHKGIIYQACNFLFLGLNSELNLMPNHSISLTGIEDGGYKWIHSRTVSSRWGSHNVEHLKKSIGKTFYRKREAGKNIYVLFIGNKKENREFIKTLKHTSLPYPKICEHKDIIEEIIVENKFNNSFFE